MRERLAPIDEATGSLQQLIELHHRSPGASRATLARPRPPRGAGARCRPGTRQHGARAAGLPIIRDAEIEQLLRDYTAPILRAAGLAQQNIQVVIINERAASTPSSSTAAASSSIPAR